MTVKQRAEFLRRAYSMSAKAPPPMAWKTYAARVRAEWSALLASEKAGDERVLQRFLEQHPSLIPGPFGSVGDNGSGHAPFPNAVITQPPLQGLGDNVPDFMWIASDSEILCPVLVEIETPRKRWFTSKGVPTAQFTQAANQLTEWRDWFSKPSNLDTFRDFYGIPDLLWRRLVLRPKFLLVYGSRREFAGRELLSRRRALQTRVDEDHMTFDRLGPEPKAEELMCVSITKPQEYRAVSWPVTGTLGPAWAEDRAIIREKAAAISRCSWLSAKRRKFLLSRVDYWDEWAQGGRGVYAAGDSE